jgi:oxalate decarboxylase
MKKSSRNNRISRRGILQVGSAVLTTAAAITGADAQTQQAPPIHSADHHLPNETAPGPKNPTLEAQNPDSNWSPDTDNGTVPPFKYSFALARKRVSSGGWTRQVTARELPISTTIAGVEMRLTAGGVRELHWHVEAEWAIMLYGHARITAVDTNGRSFVSDVSEGDLWLFPKGIPHSIQGLGPDGARFLLVFDNGNFNEFGTFLITDWLTHTPKDVLAKNFSVPQSTFDKVPQHELFIFQTAMPGDLKAEQAQASAGTGEITPRYDFRTSEMKPTKVTKGGEVKIIDAGNFPVTPITAAIVRLKPGGLRELHWHPNADEWQYFVSGKGRMTLFTAATHARTMDFQEGDVGYVPMSNPHYVENTGDTDLVFLEMFRTPRYEDISLAEWMAHTPHQLIDQHLGVGTSMIEGINKQETVITPL